jgi:hypothetical protein
MATKEGGNWYQQYLYIHVYHAFRHNSKFYKKNSFFFNLAQEFDVFAIYALTGYVGKLFMKLSIHFERILVGFSK